MKGIRQFLKKIYLFFYEQKNRYKLLKSIKKGDVVWAEMPLPKCALQEIEKNHRTRPYLVMEKGFLSVEAYPCTSQNHARDGYQNQFRILKEDYGNDKDSTVILRQRFKVPFYKLRSYFYTLSDEDIAAINKRLMMRKNTGKKDVKFLANEDDEVITKKLEEGDIIEHDGSLKYIFRVDNTKYICYKLVTKPEYTFGKMTIQINNLVYVLDYSQRCELSSNEKYQVVSKVKTTDTIRIDEEVKQAKIDKKKAKQAKKQERKGSNKKSTVVKKQVMTSPIEDENFKIGTIYKVGYDRVAFLFEKDGECYGANTLMYNISPKIIKMGDINGKERNGKLSNKELRAMIDCLIDKKVMYSKEIRDLYEKLYN